MRAQRKANKVEWREKSAMDQRADSQSPGDRLAAEEGDGCHFPIIMKEAGKKERILGITDLRRSTHFKCLFLTNEMI